MPTQIQLRRGTYAQHQNFTGAVAEPTFDTTDLVLRIHDGSSPGGMEMVMGNTIYKGTPVKVVATSNLTLYGTQTIDGVALSAGDRVLVTGQSTAYSNGIYNVSSTAWTRAFDNDKIYNLNQHQLIYVASGSNNAQTVWRQTSAAPTTIGVDAITFELWGSVELRGVAQNTVSGIVTRTAKGTYTGRTITVSGQGISITNPDGVSGNPLVTLNTTPNNTGNAIVGRDSGGSFTAQNLTLNGILQVDSGSINTISSTATLLNTTATTVNAFGAATTISLGASTGTTTVNNNMVVTGNLTVNGTTETINSTTLVVADKNIEIGKVATPTDATADGGGVTLKGATDKTINWDSANTNWTSSEYFNLASGKTYKIGNTPVLTINSVLDSGTTITVGNSATTLNLGASAGAGTTTMGSGTVVGSNATQNLFNTVATTLNIGGASTALNLGAATGVLTIANPTITGTNATTFNMNGASPSIVTSSTGTASLFNTNALTGNLFGAATSVNIGASTGTATVNNPTVTLANATTVNVNGVSPTLASTSTGTLTLFNGNITTVNAFGAASTINIGANSGTVTIGNPTVVGTQATQNLYNTVATTVNAFGAATALNFGANSGTLTLGNPTVVGTQTTQNLYNTVATTLNIGGAATSLTLGATSGTATIRNTTVAITNNATVGGTLSVTGTSSQTGNATFGGTVAITGATTHTGDIAANSGNITTTATTANLYNSTATTVNIGGAATTVSIGASTGTTTVNNNLTVTGNLTINGGTDYVQASNTVYTDNLLELHAPTGGVGGSWSSSDGKDIGIRMHYYSGGDKNAALVLAQDTGYLEWYNSGTETAGVFSGTYGTMKLGGLVNTGNATISGTLGVTGATTLSSTLGVTGATTLSSTLAVSSNTTVGGTLGVTGATTLSSTLSAGATTLSSLSVTGTSSHTGNATFGGTLGVSGAVTLSSTLSAGATTLSSLSLSSALPIASGGTGATTAQGARTNLLPAQSSGVNGYVLTTNGTDVQWSYLGNAMVTTFNGRANAVTLTSGDVTGALGYTPLSATSGTAVAAGYLNNSYAYTNGSDGWFRSAGQAGWYNASYAVGVYATQSGWVQTYNGAGMLANAFQIVSDSRLKDNIVDSKYGLSTVLQLRSVEYDKKADGKHDVGLLAQEVEQIIPEFVHEDADGMKSVNYPQMVSVLIKAVQELSAEVNALKAKLGE